MQRPSIVEVTITEPLPLNSEARPTDLENESIIPNAFEKMHKSNDEVTEAAQPVAPEKTTAASKITAVDRVKPTQSPPQAITSLTSEAIGIKTRYPRLSRILEEEGKVIVIVQTDATGKIHKMSITNSSGFERLDQAALDALSNAKSTALGKNTHTRISFLFRLK